MEAEKKMKVLVIYRQLFYSDLWKLHTKLLYTEKTDEMYPALEKEKNELEKTIGNLTVMIMKLKSELEGV